MWEISNKYYPNKLFSTVYRINGHMYVMVIFKDERDSNFTELKCNDS